MDDDAAKAKNAEEIKLGAIGSNDTTKDEKDTIAKDLIEIETIKSKKKRSFGSKAEFNE